MPISETTPPGTPVVIYPDLRPADGATHVTRYSTRTRSRVHHLADGTPVVDVDAGDGWTVKLTHVDIDEETIAANALAMAEDLIAGTAMAHASASLKHVADAVDRARRTNRTLIRVDVDALAAVVKLARDGNKPTPPTCPRCGIAGTLHRFVPAGPDTRHLVSCPNAGPADVVLAGLEARP